MTRFSDESLLIAQNWDTVVDIMRASEHMTAELSSFLLSFETDLRELEWWDQGWVFQPYRLSQVYVTAKRWLSNGKDVIWIGIQEFDAEHIFGSQGRPPSLYVWVRQAHQGLVPLLVDEMGKSGCKIKASGLYLTWQDVPKFLPEIAGDYLDMVREQFLEFADRYAQLLMQFEGAISHYLNSRTTTEAD